MTTIYFVRHSESDSNIKDDRSRPLTARGNSNCVLATNFLKDKQIDVVLSSPYKRAVDTLTDFAQVSGLTIQTVEDFREIENPWIEDWIPKVKKQWQDFSYKIQGEESLAETQKRNITALNETLRFYKDKNIAIGTHGVALSTIINFYDNSYGFDDFMDMVHLTPWVAKIEFSGFNCIKIEKINLFELAK